MEVGGGDEEYLIDLDDQSRDTAEGVSIDREISR